MWRRGRNGYSLDGRTGSSASLPVGGEAPLARTYGDIDFAARASDVPKITDLFVTAGYQADTEFNALHGRHRLFFWDPQHDREADVFLDTFTMCHALDFREHLTADQDTLPLSDLLLFKLQVMETNRKDYQDALALLSDHPLDATGLDGEAIARFLSNDWGWWRTATLVLQRIATYADELEGLEQTVRIHATIDGLVAAIEAAPKSRRWKLRARVGDRVRWYETPEDAHVPESG